MRIIDIDARNLTSVRRPAACNWVVCLENKLSSAQAKTQKGFFTLPGFVGDAKQYKNTVFLCPRKCLQMSRV